VVAGVLPNVRDGSGRGGIVVLRRLGAAAIIAVTGGVLYRSDISTRHTLQVAGGEFRLHEGGTAVTVRVQTAETAAYRGAWL
jgi:hypothetical protein